MLHVAQVAEAIMIEIRTAAYDAPWAELDGFYLENLIDIDFRYSQLRIDGVVYKQNSTAFIKAVERVEANKLVWTKLTTV